MIKYETSQGRYTFPFDVKDIFWKRISNEAYRQVDKLLPVEIFLLHFVYEEYKDMFIPITKKEGHFYFHYHEGHYHERFQLYDDSGLVLSKHDFTWSE